MQLNPISQKSKTQTCRIRECSKQVKIIPDQRFRIEKCNQIQTQRPEKFKLKQIKILNSGQILELPSTE